LDSEDLDLDRLVRMFIAEPEPTLVARNAGIDSSKFQRIQERERLTNFLKGQFEVNVQNFNYNKIEGQDFEGDLIFDKNEMLISGDVETMDGSMNLEGTTYFRDKPFLQANLITDGIDIRKFFYQCENFGQDVLKYKHLKGDLDSRLAIDAYWDENGNFSYDDLHVLADVKITDGELIRMKMIEDFSAYVKIQDLRHIKFTNMQNWVEIKNQKVYMPVMFLQSNALNLTVNGQHSFENKIDYKMKINAGQVLLSKFKKHDPKLKPQKAKRRGWFNLHYHVYGDVENFKVVNNKRLVKSDFLRSERRKREIKAKRRGWFNLHYHVYGDVENFKVVNNKRLVKSDFLRSERRKREIKAKLIEAFGNVRDIQEPIEWQDEKPLVDLKAVEEELQIEEEKVKISKPSIPLKKPTVKPIPDVAFEADEEEEFLDVFDDLEPKEKKKTDPKKKN